MATNQIFQQMERVRPKLQPWLNSFPVASNFVEKGEVETIGERDYRIPFKHTRAGPVRYLQPRRRRARPRQCDGGRQTHFFVLPHPDELRNDTAPEECHR